MDGRLLRRGVALAWALTASYAFAGEAPPSAPGVEVVSAAKGDRAAQAGVLPGDVLVHFRSGSAGGPLRGPFDVWRVEHDFAPLRPVRLTVRRGAQTLQLTLPDGEWGLEIRPVLEPSRRAQWIEALTQPTPEATRALARWLSDQRRPLDAAWLWSAYGRARLGVRALLDADAAFSSARERIAQEPGKDLSGILLWEASRALEHVEGQRAEIVAQAAADAFAAYAPEVRARQARLRLARLELVLGKLPQARAALQDTGPLPGAVRARLLGASAEDLEGLLLYAQGNLDLADARFEHAQALRSRLAPQSAALADVLEHRARIAGDRGDLTAARSLLRQAAEVRDARDDDPFHQGIDQRFLGVIAQALGDYDATLVHLDRAVKLIRRAQGDCTDTATMLASLGDVSLLLGDDARGLGFHQEALRIREDLVPDTLELAESLDGVAAALLRKGDLDRAEASLARALAIQSRLAPGSLPQATTFLLQGELALARQRPASALEHFRKVTAIRGRFAPGSAPLAEALDAEGRAREALGDLDGAQEGYQAAVDALEAARGTLRGTEDERSRFASRHTGPYRRLIALLVRRGHPERAFSAVERLHARGLLALLNEQRVSLRGDAPPELLAERARNDAAFDQAQAQLASASRKPAAQTEPLVARLTALREERERLESTLRARAPRLSSITDPTPLDVAQVQTLLAADTALLEYSVGEKETVLFVITAGGLTARALPLGAEALGQRVRAFRGLIERGRERPEPEPALLTSGQALHALLVRPAEEAAPQAKRWVVVPDGPLHLLPFNALVVQTAPLRYLAETRALSLAPSATVLAELLQRPPPRTRRVVAFGDPPHPPEPRLPQAGKEAARVAALFPREELHLGPEATERTVRERAPAARYLHLATHARLDRRQPLDSALLLASPKRPSVQDNGLLQAWEVFEHLHLDAALVTLSGCDTGLGEVVAGEGLFGLSRAFEYAGARAVVVSLWSVPDGATAGLMSRFYQGLKEGLSKDAALAAAEARVRAEPATRHPYYWAAFQLHGDPRPDRW